MPITLAGVVLPTPAPELAAWLEAHLTLDYLQEWERLYWPGADRQRWAFAVRRMPSVPQLGCLFWPTSASRFGVFWGLATDAELAKLRPLAYGGSAKWAPVTLALSDGAGGSVTTSLYLLPPRPLAQAPPLPGQPPGAQLYLVTAVDARYFWYERAADVEVTLGTTTWAQLYSSIASALGISLTVDAIPAAYLSPSDALTARYQYLPLLLDAVAYNCGQRVVVGLDGKVKAQGYAAARALQDSQAGSWPVEAGGQFLFKPSPLPHDLQGLAPASVTVAFAGVQSGTPTGNFYPVAVNLKDLALPEYPKATAPGHTGTKLYRDSAAASFTSNPATPDNLAELQALAKQTASDYYRWRLGRQGVAYAGVVPYKPEGLADSVTWVVREGLCQTRVERPPWNDLAEDLLHGGSHGAVNPVGPNVYNYFNQTFIDYIVNQYLTTLVENVFQQFINNTTVNNLTVINIFEPPSFWLPLTFPDLCAQGVKGLIKYEGTPGFFDDCCFYPIPLGYPTCYPGGGGGPPGGGPLSCKAPPGGLGLGGPPGSCPPSSGGSPTPPTSTDNCGLCPAPYNLPTTIYLVVTGYGDDGTNCGPSCNNLNGCFKLTWHPSVCKWFSDTFPWCPFYPYNSGTPSGNTTLCWAAGVSNAGAGNVGIGIGLQVNQGGGATYFWPAATMPHCALPVTFAGSASGLIGVCSFHSGTLTLQADDCGSGGGGPSTPAPSGEIPVSCCDDPGTLPATLSVTAQYRFSNPSATWNTVTPSTKLQYESGGSGPLWNNSSVGAVLAQLGNGAQAGLSLFCLSKGGFGATGYLWGKATKTFAATGGTPAPPALPATLSADTGGSFCGTGAGDGIVIEVDGVDGGWINKTAGVLYDVRFLVTR
jgi:hypothetical protein